MATLVLFLEKLLKIKVENKNKFPRYYYPYCYRKVVIKIDSRRVSTNQNFLVVTLSNWIL